MYDELVENLRESAEWADRLAILMGRTDGDTHAPIMREAADAIEELSEYVNCIWQLKCEGWYLQQTKYHDGYQAMAKMPLPEPPKKKQ